MPIALALALAVMAAAPKSGKKPKSPPPAPAAAPAEPAPPPAAPAATPEVTAAPAPAAAVPEAPVAAPAAPKEAGLLSVGILDFASSPELQPLAGALGGFVANELQRLGAFQVTTTDQIRAMLSLERQAQLLGCPDESCRGQTVVSLGFDYVVTGKVSKLASGGKGSTLTLELVLIDQNKGARAGSDVVTAPSESELMTRVSASAVKLVGVLLKGRSGGLVLSSSEAGATVKIDDVIVGTTPVGQTTVAGGPHVVAVEKNGFVTWQKEVRVKPNEAVEESVRLVPSPDFIEAYKSKQTALRIALIGSVVVAAAGIALAVGTSVHAQSLYGSEQQPGTFLYERKLLNDGIEEDANGNHREKANQLKAQVETMRTLTWVGIGAGAVGAVASAAFWLLGDDPSKYDRYRATDVKVKVGAFVSPAGGSAVLSGSF